MNPTFKSFLSRGGGTKFNFIMRPAGARRGGGLDAGRPRLGEEERGHRALVAARHDGERESEVVYAMGKEADLVEVIGPSQTVDDVAMLTGTIGYEVLTSLGCRFHRRYLG